MVLCVLEEAEPPAETWPTMGTEGPMSRGAGSPAPHGAFHCKPLHIGPLKLLGAVALRGTDRSMPVGPQGLDLAGGSWSLATDPTDAEDQRDALDGKCCAGVGPRGGEVPKLRNSGMGLPWEPGVVAEPPEVTELSPSTDMRRREGGRDGTSSGCQPLEGTMGTPAGRESAGIAAGGP